ncbi:MAG: hypothetical protein RLZ51_1861 [Pseudomonadota bacterium]
MASNPIETQMWAKIEKMGGIDRIIERVAEGESLKLIAEEMGVSRSFLSWKVNKVPGVKERLVQARKSRADKWAEEAIEIADNVDPDPNQINKARLRIDSRKWLAGVDDPDRFGTKQTQVNISLGGLHLDALRKVQADLAKPVGQTIEGEARDVSED